MSNPWIQSNILFVPGVRVKLKDSYLNNKKKKKELIYKYITIDGKPNLFTITFTSDYKGRRYLDLKEITWSGILYSSEIFDIVD